MGNTLPVYIPCLINKIKCICTLLALGHNTMSNVDNQAAFYKYCIHPTEGWSMYISLKLISTIGKFVWEIAGQNHAFSNFFNIDSGVHWPHWVCKGCF